MPPRQQATRSDTRPRKTKEPEPMKTAGRKAEVPSKDKATKRAAKPARPALKPKKKKPVAVNATVAKVKTKAKAKVKPIKAKAKAHVVKARAKAKTVKAKTRTKTAKVKATLHSAMKLNPNSAEALAKVWKAWTGAEPDKLLRLMVENAGRYKMPAQVVMLGRVSWLATKDGQEKRFGETGPLMVTDGKAERIWLVSNKVFRVDLEPALIGYLARKPKFGDRQLVEYVHAFEGRAHAVMSGQVGALTGTFRITPAGLEG